mmetsp:Transcript_15099/g.40344  ORF Transcript_15099/g.40344 Transcript_15099/m.40344 type:complete len:247 (+) Transcript_15099:118-858(+)
MGCSGRPHVQGQMVLRAPAGRPAPLLLEPEDGGGDLVLLQDGRQHLPQRLLVVDLHGRHEVPKQLALLLPAARQGEREERREEPILRFLYVLEHHLPGRVVLHGQGLEVEPEDRLHQLLLVAVGLALVAHGAARERALEDAQGEALLEHLHGDRLQIRVHLIHDVHVVDPRCADLRQSLDSAPPAGIVGAQIACVSVALVSCRGRDDDEGMRIGAVDRERGDRQHLHPAVFLRDGPVVDPNIHVLQ